MTTGIQKYIYFTGFAGFVWVCLLLLPNSSAAEPHRVRLSTHFQNHDWFPLSKTEMQSAAVDAALAELTRKGAFVFSDKDGPGVGLLTLNVSLVEVAELVKISMTLDLAEVSYVATAATSLRGMNRQGIFRAFEHVGTTAAQRMRLKLVPASGNGLAKTENLAAKALYDKAQQLKQETRFEEAATRFATIERLHPDAGKWLLLAQDEIRYGLPLFEAKYRITEMGRFSANPMEIFKPVERANQLFRQILAENTDKIERIQEAQRYLDELSFTQRALQNSIEAQSLSHAHEIKFFLMTHYNDQGTWPDENEMKSILKTLTSDFEILGYLREENGLKITLEHRTYKTPLLLTGSDRGRITLEVQRDL